MDYDYNTNTVNHIGVDDGDGDGVADGDGHGDLSKFQTSTISFTECYKFVTHFFHLNNIINTHRLTTDYKPYPYYTRICSSTSTE